MKLLTVTNLFPRPDQPQRGLFNAQLFGAMAARHDVDNVCLVPEYRPWKWSAIRRWSTPAPTRRHGGDGSLTPHPNTDSSAVAPAKAGHRPVRRSLGEGGTLNTVFLPVFYLPVIGRALSAWTYALSLRRLRERIRNADVIYAAWLYPDGTAAARLAASCDRPCWIMVQGSDTLHLRSPFRRKQIAAWTKDVRGFVCVSPNLAERLVDAGIDRDRVHVVPNGVDTTRFRYRDREEVRARLFRGQPAFAQSGSGEVSAALRETGIRSQESGGREPRRGRVVLFVGNLVPVKGPDLLLTAWQKVLHTNHPIIDSSNLYLIGDGPMRTMLEKQAAALGMADRVQFLGRRPHNEVALWMSAADVLCLASRNEGMPNVVQEALASGLPVVATDVGACRQMLEQEPLARVVARPPEDAGHEWASVYARAVTELLTTAADRQAMAQRHADIRTWAQCADDILELMQDG